MAEHSQAFELHFREVLESISLLAVCLDTAGGITFCNNSLLEATGWEMREVMGKNWFELFVPGDNWFLRQIFFSNIGKGSIPQIYDNDILTRDGGMRFVSWRNTMLRNSNGEVVGLASIGEDITARKRAEEELCASQEQLKELVSELAYAEERERRRIATELHDGVAQSLVFAKFKVNDFLAACQDPEQQKTAGEIKETLNTTIEEIRSLTFQLSPPLLYEVGFEAALEWLGEQFQSQHGFRVEIKKDKSPKPLSDDVAITLFQMVRELLINVVKHAFAKKVVIKLSTSRGRLIIAVTDDGAGIDPDTLASNSSMPPGFGLFNIRQRMMYIKGVMTMESEKGKGTTITLYAPLATGC